MSMRHIVASFLSGAVLALTGTTAAARHAQDQHQIQLQKAQAQAQALAAQNKKLCSQLKLHKIQLPSSCR